MDSLFPSGTYNVIQRHEVPTGKSMIFVKLTDSAYRALNDYLKKRDMYHQTPMIEFFEDSGGRIEIPTSQKGVFEAESCSAIFKFNLESNAVMQGRQGSFECVKHEYKSKTIKNCGPLTKRLKIHANDDSFEVTKNRMAEVEFEQRKICTKQIDLKLETVNRQVRVEKGRKLKVSVCTSITPIPPRPKIASIKLGLPKSIRTCDKNLNSSAKFDSPIAKRPLKERIMHMLAVRPLKKIEISVALKREGLRDSDKNILNSTLMSVATIKDNHYHLLKHMWNDVQDDWPFYTVEDKRKIQKNKQENITSSSLYCSAIISNVSPKISVDDQLLPRTGYIKGVDGLPTKRQRISHFNRPNLTPVRPADDERMEHKIPSSTVTNGSDDIKKSLLPNLNKKTSPPKVNPKPRSKYLKSKTPKIHDLIKYNKASIDGNSSHEPDVNAQSIVVENGVSDPGTITDGIGEILQVPLSDGLSLKCSMDLPKISDFTKAYITITNTDQRRQYKKDFIMYYNEYMVVNEEVIPITLELIQLQERYRQCEKGPDGSSTKQETESQIVQKCNELINADCYRVKRERHRYLHDLLLHIKKLVVEYDDRMF